MRNTKADIGILCEIEAHLAPLGWHFEDLYDNPGLLSDIRSTLHSRESEDRALFRDECDFGVKYYEEMQTKMILEYARHENEHLARKYRNASRRGAAALKGLAATRVSRTHLKPQIEELKSVLAALKTANRYQSRLPSCYSEEALLP